MANPKKKKTHSKTHMGRAHLALKKVTLKKCPKCGEMRKPHTVCAVCGTYKGKESVAVKAAPKTAKKK